MNTYADDNCKPCPFCGQLPDLEKTNLHWTWRIECKNKNCKVNLVTGDDSKEKAVEKWNNRSQ